MDHDIPADLADYLVELDDFIESEIRPLEEQDDNIRFFDHRREDARTDWDRDGLPNRQWEELLAEARRRADEAGSGARGAAVAGFRVLRLVGERGAPTFTARTGRVPGHPVTLFVPASEFRLGFRISHTGLEACPFQFPATCEQENHRNQTFNHHHARLLPPAQPRR